MRILESNNTTTDLHEIYITIDVSEHYVEMVEIHRESKNGPGFVQVTSLKTIEPQSSRNQDINTNSGRFEPWSG